MPNCAKSLKSKTVLVFSTLGGIFVNAAFPFRNLDCDLGQASLYRGRHGEHRIVLETGIQNFGRTSPGDPGQSGAGQSPSRQEDGSYRLPMVSGSVTAWVGSTEFYSSTRYPRIAGSDTTAANAVAKRDPGTQPCAKGFGRCQCQNRQRAQRCFWNVGTSDAGGATGKQAQCGTGSRLGAGIVAAENSSDCGSA